MGHNLPSREIISHLVRLPFCDVSRHLCTESVQGRLFLDESCKYTIYYSVFRCEPILRNKWQMPLE
jgi:hypothetical protein